MRNISAAFALSLCALAVPAWAQERDYCPARPGLGTPACTIAPGRVSIETGLVDWQRDDTADARSDAIVIGDTLVRIGLTDTIEAQVGWTPFGRLRARDKATGAVSTFSRVGDAYLGVAANLANPDGSGYSIAVLPFVTVPVGRAPVGAGDWGAGLVVPMSYDLSDTLNLQFTGEADAATDGDGDGRHFAYSGTLGLGFPLSDAIGATIEVQGLRDQDPDGRSTQWLGALSVGWMPSADVQIDVGANIGLNPDAADAQVYFGISRRL